MYSPGGDDFDPQVMVVKHWRQDWTYENTKLLTYRGHDTWGTTELTPEQAEGTWTQAVYQTDDSPRYASYGRWVHTNGLSTWESEETWRPLPRREYTKRSDYHVLVCRNRHTLTPTGWAHEQDNQKLVLDEAGQPVRVVAHERGLNRYDRADNVDFSAARDYWQQTGPFWAQVRGIWDDIFATGPKLKLQFELESGERLSRKMRAMAGDVREAGVYDADTYRDQIRAALTAHVVQ